MLVEAASRTISLLTFRRPLNGCIFLAVSAFSSTEFLAEMEKSSALTLSALPYAISAFATSAVTPMSLNLRVLSLRDALSSGPSLMPIPFMSTSIVSAG